MVGEMNVTLRSPSPLRLIRILVEAMDASCEDMQACLAAYYTKVLDTWDIFP